jgi:hypothetical protein
MFKVQRVLSISWEVNSMKRGFGFGALVYVLCVSFLLLANGFHTMVAEAKEIGRPIGEMVSRGEVKFESRESVWKNVEPSHYPIFQGAKIKTEKGGSVVTLTNDSQVLVASRLGLSVACAFWDNTNLFFCSCWGLGKPSLMQN